VYVVDLCFSSMASREASWVVFFSPEYIRWDALRIPLGGGEKRTHPFSCPGRHTSVMEIYKGESLAHRKQRANWRSSGKNEGNGRGKDIISRHRKRGEREGRNAHNRNNSGVLATSKSLEKNTMSGFMERVQRCCVCAHAIWWGYA
jgi:hypothetical protein